MIQFEGSGLTTQITTRTVQQANGHSLVPGSNTEYFAPPDTDPDWIPLAEENWNYASMWYKITPTSTNGLDGSTYRTTYRWPNCWTIGTCLSYLLNKVTSGTVIFNESSAYSQFLYDHTNPVEGSEPFTWLVTQKSNVMHPAATGASRCTVTLDWFLSLLRNAFNCYYWLEPRNDGKYDFRIEHVEYFRRGGSYTGTLQPQIDLTVTKPFRNFFRNNSPVKRLADGTNHYTFELGEMAERYTFSWQGDGGSDDFKGNPMLFKAGWVERSKSENHEVDNIFADLNWLMLNAGTDTESSKNYEGLFIFGGYQAAVPSEWTENSPAISRYLVISESDSLSVDVDVWVTIPEGQTAEIQRITSQSTVIVMGTVTGTGSPQRIRVNFIASISGILQIDFGTNYSLVTIHRVHYYDTISVRGTNVYYVATVQNLLRPEFYLQNGTLAWPWLQNEYLHYDVPAQKWSYDSDDLDTATFLNNGTIKLVKQQTINVAPLLTGDPDASQGVRTGLGTGVISQAKINLSSRNCEFTLLHTLS